MFNGIEVNHISATDFEFTVRQGSILLSFIILQLKNDKILIISLKANNIIY